VGRFHFVLQNPSDLPGLVMTNIAIENGHVDFPMKNGGSFHSYVSLPEGITLVEIRLIQSRMRYLNLDLANIDLGNVSSFQEYCNSQRNMTGNLLGHQQSEALIRYQHQKDRIGCPGPQEYGNTCQYIGCKLPMKVAEAFFNPDTIAKRNKKT